MTNIMEMKEVYRCESLVALKVDAPELRIPDITDALSIRSSALNHKTKNNVSIARQV